MKKICTQFLLVGVLAFSAITTFAQQTSDSKYTTQAKHIEVKVSPQTIVTFVAYGDSLFLDGQTWTLIEVPGTAPFYVTNSKGKNRVQITFTSRTTGQPETMPYDYEKKKLIF